MTINGDAEPARGRHHRPFVMARSLRNKAFNTRHLNSGHTLTKVTCRDKVNAGVQTRPRSRKSL
jgi:hypothetical protein